jgi:FlaA1/EpsC-like NDP-sugar epimerase
VFHAAAYKHVPILESNPCQAVVNNIYGSMALMRTAQRFNAERFVLVSTDKAVRPTNVMGASKRVTELMMYGVAEAGSTKFMAVRFGNVVGSSGSVIPLFKRQIAQGGPVLVTHPEVTRYFMTISEAAQLILQAGGLGKGGEIFILDMGTPIRIADMARDLIRLMGKEPEEDVQIEFTGLRPGEKLSEELMIDDSNLLQTDHEKILVLGNEISSATGIDSFGAWLQDRLDELYRLADQKDPLRIKAKLAEIVPEYRIWDEAGSQERLAAPQEERKSRASRLHS